MDHKWVTVDLNEKWWGEPIKTTLMGSDWDRGRGVRINTGEWTTDEWKKYRQVAKARMDPKDETMMPPVEMHEQIVFMTGTPRRIQTANSGVGWEYSTKDIRTAWKWSESWKKNGQRRYIKAIRVQSTVAEGGEALDLSKLSTNKARKLGAVATKYNVDNAVVLIKEGCICVEAEVELKHDQNELANLQWWAEQTRQNCIQERFTGPEGALNLRLEQLVQVVRVAAQEASGSHTTEERVLGVNRRPLWSPVLKAVERERKLLRDMKWAMERYFDTNDEKYLQLARVRSAEWEVE